MAIPEILTSVCGQKIDSVEKWEKYRRPEIMTLFSNFVYGVRPVEKPDDLKFEVICEKDNFDGDESIKQKHVKVSFAGMDIFFYAYYPKKEEKVPAVVYVMHEHQFVKTDFDSDQIFGPNIKYITSRGYALFVMPTHYVAEDYDHNGNVRFQSEIFKRLTPTVENRKGNDWAVISAWAWGASRVMDFIQTDGDVDTRFVSVVGHSRGGKTALWCGATDTRFACAVSNNSGCTGASLHRGERDPKIEDTKDINRFDWFCNNYQNYNDNEDMLPVDQHMLIGALAPRYVYVASSSEDAWAGPKKEFLASHLASEAFELYGKKGLVAPSEAELDTPYHEGNIGYHIKTGPHSITDYDWQLYLDFFDKKFK